MNNALDNGEPPHPGPLPHRMAEGGNAPRDPRSRDRNILLGMPQLRTIGNLEELGLVRAAAMANGHGLMCPTHWVEKEGEIVGSFSLDGMPLVTMWLHTEKVKPRESLGLINSVENFYRLKGAKLGAVLVSRSSPFHGLMGAMGYRETEDMTVFVKEM